MNDDTLVAVHCWQGDQHLVEAFMPQYQAHGCPIVILSPIDSPVRIDGVECRSAGKRGYFGQASLDRQREHLKLLLEYPQRWFLLCDADSFCLSPELPRYLYDSDNTIWANVVREMRPHKSPWPKQALHPPYFLARETIEKLLAVGPVEAHEITPFVDWLMLVLACEAGVTYRSFPDGKSFPAWRHGAIPETKELGHDYVHEPTERGVDGARRMAHFVRQGTNFVHSVKHPPVRDMLVTAYEARRAPRSVPKPQVEVQAPASDLSVLVAFRDSGGPRTQVWELIRERFERMMPEVQVCVASDDGDEPFHKTLAINRAAKDATGDILAIWDADTWCDPEAIRAAAAHVRANPARWWRPWYVKLKLNEAATNHVLAAGASWDGEIEHKTFGRPESRNTYQYAPPMLLSREAFETVGGMDERFRGWGSEDLAFALALNKLVGTGGHEKGNALHLWHPRIGRSGADLWAGQDDAAENKALAQRYRAARTPEQMRELLALTTV